MPANVNVDNLEPNSHKYKREMAEEKKREKLKPVVQNDKVVSTKKSLTRKFAESFVSRDREYLKDYILWDVVVPGIKDAIFDMLQMAFFGEVLDRRPRRGRERRERREESRVRYSSYYGGSSYDSSSRRRDRRYERDNEVDPQNIVLRNRADAEDVVDEMRKRIEVQGAASVADLLDLIDVASNWTDTEWGWTRKRDIGIRVVSDGFLIDVPSPEYIKD